MDKYAEPVNGMSYLEGILIRGGETFIANFFDRVDLVSAFKLSKTCIGIRAIIHLYINTRYDTDTLLEQWVDDGPSFRAQLFHARGIIVGNVPLCFLRRTKAIADVHPLEIFVEMEGIFGLGSYLQSQGYVFEPRPRDPQLFGQAVLQCSTVSRTARATKPPKSPLKPIINEFKFDCAKQRNDGTWVARTVKIALLRVSPIHHVLSSSESE